MSNSKEPVVPEGSSRILIVEDDPELTGVLRDFLSAHGLAVSCVGNGVDGLRSVMEHEFDAVICDMLMPEMPGDMFYLAVKQVKPELVGRFVFVTAHSESPRVREFLAEIPEQVLRKPFHLQDLQTTLDGLLANRGEPRNVVPWKSE